jgi:hypothetical protein
MQGQERHLYIAQQDQLHGGRDHLGDLHLADARAQLKD